MIPRAKPTLMETFQADIRQFVLSTIPVAPDDLAALNSKGAVELLAIYANWRRRYVDPMPRKIHTSSAFRTSAYQNSPGIRTDIPALVAKIERGDDVRPHLSARVTTGFERVDPAKPKKVTARRDMDMLLNDWGVHHLHLSSASGPNGFTKRGPIVLLGAFTNTDAYLIDLVEHGRWSDDNIVRIMAREWPDAGLIYQAHGMMADSASPTTEERAALRSVGMQAMVNIGPDVYFGGGFASNGIASLAMGEAMHTFRKLETFAKWLEADPMLVARSLLQNGVTPPSEPDLHFGVMPVGGWGVFEAKTRTMMGLP